MFGLGVSRRKRVPLLIDRRDIYDLFEVSKGDADIIAATRAIVTAAMTPSVTVHIGFQGNADMKPEIVKCNSLNELLNNGMKPDRREMKEDILTFGFCVYRVIPINSDDPYQDNDPMILDIGPGIRNMIVARHLTDIFGETTSPEDDDEVSEIEDAKDGRDSFMPQSFPNWMNANVVGQLSCESMMDMIDKGEMIGKQYHVEGSGSESGQIMDGDLRDLEEMSNLEKIADTSESGTGSSENKNKNNNKKNEKEKYLHRVLKNTQVGANMSSRYILKRVDPLSVRIYVIVDENDMIIDARAVPMYHKGLRTIYLDEYGGGSKNKEHPFCGMRVHLSSKYLSVINGAVVINTPVSIALNQVLRRERIELAQFQAMEKNINREVAITRQVKKYIYFLPKL